MMHMPSSRYLSLALLSLSILTAAGVQAAQNPFALERADSRLPVIAQNDAADAATTGKKAEVMQCGGAGTCGGGMATSEKPVATTPDAKSGKCGGASSETAKPASSAAQCGGGN